MEKGIKYVALVHSDDIDGIGSAALLRMKYKIPLNRIFFATYSDGSLDYVARKISSIKGRISLFVADLGVNEPLIKYYKQIINHVKKNGGSVAWLDHHPWSDYMIKEIATMCDIAVVGENIDNCGTQLVLKATELDSSFARKFTEIVHLSDFNLKTTNKEYSRLIKTYALSISSFKLSKSAKARDEKLRHMVKVISSGKFDDAYIRKESDTFEKLNDERINFMLKHLINFSDKMSVGFSSKVQNTNACDRIMKYSKCDCAVLINVDTGKGSIRRGVNAPETPNINPLAVALGGGGHPKAAGFRLDPRKYYNFKSESSRRKAAEYIWNKAVELDIYKQI